MRSLLAASLLFVLGCSGILPVMPDGQPLSSVGPAARAVPEPWASLRLPLDGAQVVAASAASLSVTVPGADAVAATESFAAAIEASGYARGVVGEGGALIVLRRADGAAPREIVVASRAVAGAVLVAISG